MKTKFYIDGKKTTRKAVQALIGDADLKNKVAEAKEILAEDPYEQASWWIGKGTLTIEFEF